MLITRSGFKAFNEYDLSATLDAQLNRLKEDVKIITQSEKTVETPLFLEKYKLSLLVFDVENMTVNTSTAMIPAEYFPRSSFLVESGEKYQKEVLTFRLPFTGDQSLLRCVPSTRILRTEEISQNGDAVVFELINFNNNVENMRRDRDSIVNFLVQQSANVNKQVDQYNNTIEQVIVDTEGKTKEQSLKQGEFLKQLGTPILEENLVIPTIDSKKNSSRLSEKKPEIFDVFICHANEDKAFVDKLADDIKNDKISVWYDSFQIGWGDDLRTTIDNGLKNSRYGVVVFSEAFFQKKKWTEYELNGLFSKEKNGQKVVLPVWHNITKEEIARYSPAFADRVAKGSDNIPSIINELKKLLQRHGKKKK